MVHFRGDLGAEDVLVYSYLEIEIASFLSVEFLCKKLNLSCNHKEETIAILDKVLRKSLNEILQSQILRRSFKRFELSLFM